MSSVQTTFMIPNHTREQILRSVEQSQFCGQGIVGGSQYSTNYGPLLKLVAMSIIINLCGQRLGNLIYTKFVPFIYMPIAYR